MWKKGDIVWVRLNPSDTWIPGRILDLSALLGILVSFFDLLEPRYVPKPCLRNFERYFGTLISDSWRLRRFVNQALRAHFWNISFGLWCSCQPPIDSPYFDRENSLPWFPLTSVSALGFARDMAISLRVPLRRLAESNSSSAQILSFRRYTVDFKRSKSIYEEVRESAKLMDHSEESDWFLDFSNKMDCIDSVPVFPKTAGAEMENSSNWSVRDPLPKNIPCYLSPSEQAFEKVIQVSKRDTENPLTSFDSSTMKACGTMAQTADNDDNGHRCKSGERCQVEQTICLLNSEPPIEDTTSVSGSGVAVSEALLDVMTETHDAVNDLADRTSTSAKHLLQLVDMRDDKAFLAKPVSFVVPRACKILASSIKKHCANPRNKPDSSMINVNTFNQEPSDRIGARENCCDNALESYNVEVPQVSLHITGTSTKEFSSDDVGIAPAEQLQDLEDVTTVENQTRAVDNVRSIGVKRKASPDKSYPVNFKRKKKAGQQSISTDKPLNLHLMKDIQFAYPKCLRMKFSNRHGNLPSKSELLKRFSVFGKIDVSRTVVNPEKTSAKVVFLQSIDAVTAYQYARTKKFTLGRYKVMYWLDPFEKHNEVNKGPVSQKPQQSVPSPRSCLKKHVSVDNEQGRRNLKVKFQMETN